MSFTNNLTKLLDTAKSSGEKVVVFNRRYCIQEYGQRYHRFFRSYYAAQTTKSYIYDGSTLLPKDLADSIAEDVDDEELSELTVSFNAVSFYKQISHTIKHQPSGNVVIFRAHELDVETASLIDQLGRTARKHSLDWNFILLADLRKMARNLPSRFVRVYRIPKHDVVIEKTRPKRIRLTLRSWLAIGLALFVVLALGYALSRFFVDSNGEYNTVSEAPRTSNYENVDVSSEDAPSIIGDAKKDSAENQSADYGRRLNDWDNFNRTKTEIGLESSAIEIVGLRMSTAIEQAFNNRNNEALLQWFTNNPVDVVDSKSSTALIRSLSMPTNQLFDLLLERGANFDSADNAGKTPLAHACIQGDTDAVRSLLKKGANPNLSDELQKTPLMAAVYNGHFEISDVLLKNAANPNLQDRLGWTALFYAVWQRDRMLEALLIEHDADITLKNTQGADINDIRDERF